MQIHFIVKAAVLLETFMWFHFTLIPGPGTCFLSKAQRF